MALGAAGWVAVAGAAGLFAYLALRAGCGDWGAWREWLIPAAARTGVAALLGVAGVTAGSVLRLLAALAGVIGGAGRDVSAGRDAGARIAECGEVAGGAVGGGRGTVAGG